MTPARKKQDVAYDEICLGPLKMYPPGFTIWDKLDIPGPGLTLGNFLIHMREIHQLEVIVLKVIQGQDVTMYDGT